MSGKITRLPATPITSTTPVVAELLRGVVTMLGLPIPRTIGELAGLADHARHTREDLDLATIRETHRLAASWLRSAGIVDELHLDRFSDDDREAVLVMLLAAHELLAALASTPPGYYRALTVVLPLITGRTESISRTALARSRRARAAWGVA